MSGTTPQIMSAWTCYRTLTVSDYGARTFYRTSACLKFGEVLAGAASYRTYWSAAPKKSCLRSAVLSDWIGYRAADFLLRAAPAGVMINDTEQNRPRRLRRRLRKHSGNVHFRRLQGIPLTPMPPAGGRSSGRAPRKGDYFEQKTRYPPHAL